MNARLGNQAKSALLAAGIMTAALSATTLWGDEPGRLGRLLGIGNSARPAASTASAPGSSISPTSMTASSSSPGQKLVPQPRNTKAATEADPLVTRVSLCRAEDGKPFCAFLQVYADGTVMDSEGVHKVGADLLKPIAQAIQSGELTRLKGHCGGPAADYVEQVHAVVYDRYLGRLRAHSFSYSGNPQGCEPAVRQLNAAVDAIQTKLMGPPVPASPTASPTANTSPLGKPIGLSPTP